MSGAPVQVEVDLVVPAGRMAAAQQVVARAQAAAPAAVLQSTASADCLNLQLRLNMPDAEALSAAMAQMGPCFAEFDGWVRIDAVKLQGPVKPGLKAGLARLKPRSMQVS